MVRCAAQHVERADADGQAAEVAKLLICRLSDHVSLVLYLIICEIRNEIQIIKLSKRSSISSCPEQDQSHPHYQPNMRNPYVGLASCLLSVTLLLSVLTQIANSCSGRDSLLKSFYPNILTRFALQFEYRSSECDIGRLTNIVPESTLGWQWRMRFDIRVHRN